MASIHSLPNYRIAVVGSGAMGCYYGGKLAAGGRDVHFLMRSDYEHVKKHGLRICTKGGDFRLQGVKCYRETEDIGPVDLVLIALKTTSNEALKELIPPLLHENTMLLTLQNGLGNEEFLAENFGAHRIMGGLCFVCINRTAPGEIVHIGEGRIGLGEYDPGDGTGGASKERTHEVCWELERCGIVCSVVENLATERWRKLVWNIPFNGLSIVACGIDTSRILENAELLALTRQLMHETIGIAEKLGHDIPMSFAEKMIDVTGPMGEYRPSSLIDFLEGREVEVEPIWGEPYRRGLKAGADVGRLQTLYRLLKHQVATRATG